MSANIGRLVFDLTGPMLIWAVFMFASFAFDDVLWLKTLLNDHSLSLLPGLLASGAAQFPGVRKVAIWRTLPVSRRDIDLARWWQTVAAPQIILVILLMASAIGMEQIGQSHKAWIDIEFATVAQCLVCAGASSFLLVNTIAARKWGRWSSVLTLPVVFLLFSIGFRISPPAAIPSGSVIAAMIVCTLTIDAALYLWAGSWPLPLTSPVWGRPAMQTTALSLPLARWGSAWRDVSQQFRGANSENWPLFGRNEFSGIALMMVVQSLLLLLLQRWVSVPVFIIITVWFAAAAGAMVPIANLATAIRALRGLPMGTWQLIGRVMALLLMIQGLLLAGADAILFLSGLGIAAPVLLLLPLSLPSVLFPLALRLGSVGIALGLICEAVMLWPVGQPLLHSLAPPVIIAGAISVIALGTAWTYWEITKGRRAYRAQPSTPLRWRGEF